MPPGIRAPIVLTDLSPTIGTLSWTNRPNVSFSSHKRASGVIVKACVPPLMCRKQCPSVSEDGRL
jgi:hypothetical protein